MSSSDIVFSQSSWAGLSVIRQTFLGGSVLFSIFLFVKWATAIPRSKFPPGPKGIPIFGNLFQLEISQPWVQFTKWKKIYGPLVYLNLGGQPALILNDAKVVAELLERRAGIYSDRPRNIVGGEILTGGFLLPLARYGDMWRRMRRASHEALKMTSAPQYHPIQQTEALLLASDFLKDSGHWAEHLRRATASVITTMVFDIPPLKSISDPNVKTVAEMNTRLSNSLIPGAFLVEIFPIMKYIPRAIAKWKREAEDFHTSYNKVFESRYTEIRARLLSGEDQRPSFCSTLAETSSRHNMTTREAAWLTATMFVAGSDTTATTLEWFVLAMTAFPEVQRKAQAELDEVVGRERLPSFSDWDDLVYLRALIKETIRWRPTLPVAIPRAPIEDDWYEGYFIPKGTICFGNVWALNHDPDIYGPDVDEFKPSRHIDEHGKHKLSPDTKDEGHYGFGFGRRICVGRTFANYSSFINMATILWAMNMEPGKDENGDFVKLDVGKVDDDGVLARPASFECVMTPRFPGAEQLLNQAKDEALASREMPTHIVKPIMIDK